jgi:hypothetical protein
MMVFNIIAPLSEVTGLPPIVFICALVIILFLIVFGILILIKVRNIIRVLNRVNSSLDIILLRVGKQLGGAGGPKTNANRLRSGLNTDGNLADNNGSGHQASKIMPISSSKKKSKKSLADLPTAGLNRSETDNNKNALQRKKPEEHAIHREIGTKIHELLKKSGKPTTYHDLTEKLSKVYPGYDYDYFIKEVEALQKEGKVQVQLVAGKLYFQAKKP